MSHVQQQILDALKARLAAGGTAAGNVVFVDRLDPLPKGKRAAILVREADAGETIEGQTFSGLQERTMAVEIAAVLRLDSCEAPSAEAREFGLAIEKLLSPTAENAEIRAAAKDWSLTLSRPAQSGEGEDAVVSRVQTWLFKYFTDPSAPDQPL